MASSRGEDSFQSSSVTIDALRSLPSALRYQILAPLGTQMDMLMAHGSQSYHSQWLVVP